MASGPWKAPHQQAGHMAAPTSRASFSKKTLANREPSTHGTKQTSISTLNMSAFGGKADISDRLADVR